jgi:hypothetical protein
MATYAINPDTGEEFIVPEDFAAPAATPAPGASIFSTVVGGVTDIVRNLVSPQTVTPIINRMVYGATGAPAPRIVAPPPAAAPFGVSSNMILLIGGVVLAGIFLTGGKRR